MVEAFFRVTVINVVEQVTGPTPNEGSIAPQCEFGVIKKSNNFRVVWMRKLFGWRVMTAIT